MENYRKFLLKPVYVYAHTGGVKRGRVPSEVSRRGGHFVNDEGDACKILGVGSEPCGR